MSVKSDHVNLENRALIAWMSLRHILWKFGIMPQYYNTTETFLGLTRLQNRKDYEDRGLR